MRNIMGQEARLPWRLEQQMFPLDVFGLLLLSGSLSCVLRGEVVLRRLMLVKHRVQD